MKTFELVKGYSVDCEYKNTSYGFKHTAKLYKNGQYLAEAKCTYYNRTWETFEYESVARSVLNTYFGDKWAAKYIEALKPTKNEHFKTVSLICGIGQLLCKTKEQKNKWDKKMLGTINGLNFPDNWNSLSEAEKEKRLKGAKGELKKL